MVGSLAFTAVLATACGDYANSLRGDPFVPNGTGPNPNNLPNANGVPNPGSGGGHAVSVSPVVISEVLVDPNGPNAGYQFAELWNTGATSLGLGGWKLTAGNSTFPFPYGCNLSAGGRVVVNLGAAGATTSLEQFAPSFGELLGAGSLALLRGGSELVDFVQWGSSGQAYEAAAASAGRWTAGYALNVPAEGLSLHYDSAGGNEGACTPGA